MAPSIKRLKEIESELGTLVHWEKRPWVKIGIQLNAAHDWQGWEQNERSFSAWLADIAEKLELNPSNLWRYYSAIRWYNETLENEHWDGTKLPPAISLSNTTSPENIELLAKLQRVLPDREFKELASKVVFGKVSRSAMREVWEIYRPALQGKTARGRSSSAPRIDVENPTQMDAKWRADFVALIQHEASWTGASDPSLYKVIPAVSFYAEEGPKIEFDAVVLLQRSPKTPLEFHGVKILPPSSRIPKRTAALLGQKCDFIWFVSSDPDMSQGPDSTSGILIVVEAKVQVAQQPQNSSTTPNHSAELARTILQQVF
ncbi:hypothetical protein [Dongia soli]